MHKILLPPRAVLFDLDDTLFDHLHSTCQGLQVVCQSYSRFQEHPIDELLVNYMRLLDEVHLRVLEGSLTIDEARRERFRRFFLLYGPETEDLPRIVEHAARLHREAYQASRQPVAGVVPLMEYLHGRVKIAIVTNNLVTEQVEKLRHLKLDHLIDELITSEETGYIKPDPAIFHVALARIGCRTEEAVMIGDAWKSDVLGATRAGIRTIWFNRSGVACPEPDLAVEIRAFEPLEEILALIIGDANSE
jgi:5'-nucleotidase